MKKVIEWAEGNPGAATFLIKLLSPDNRMKAAVILSILEKTSIRGTDLYILWSDLCDKDMLKVCSLCINCPTDILEDVCSRQDRSGVSLVKKYMEPLAPQLN